MKKNYLEKYFDENLNLKERLTINKKIYERILGFFLCSLFYLITKAVPSHKLSGDINQISTFDFYDTVMFIAYIITIIGTVIFIINLFKPINIDFKIKKIIFNILDWVIILPICVCLSTIVFNYVLTIAEVSGDSMLPTIQNKEQMVLFYDNDYEREDIVVIDVQPSNNLNVVTNKYYIKRIIGMENEQIKIIENNNKIEIYINDQLYEESFYKNNLEVFDYSFFNISKYQKEQNLGIFIEEDGRVLFTYVKEDGTKEKTYTIPEGYYFVLGDNRGNSKDSREIGLIRKTDIAGIIKYRIENNFILNWGEVE